MSPTEPPRYTLSELAGLAGVTPRTVRYYISQGLLPSIGTSGPGAKYGDAQLARLRLIRRLQREHLPLAAIRQRIEGLDDASVLSLAEPPAPEPPDSALDYIRRVIGQGTPPRAASPSPSAASTPPGAASPLPSAASTPPQSPTHARPTPSLFTAGDHPVPAPPASPAVAPAPPPQAQLHRAQWERVSFTPDIELHVRRPLPRTLTRRVDRLIAIARDLLEEDQP